MGTIDRAHGTVVSIADSTVHVAIAMSVYRHGAKFKSPEGTTEHKTLDMRMVVIAPPVVVIIGSADSVAGASVIIGIEAYPAAMAVVAHVARVPHPPAEEVRSRGSGMHIVGIYKPGVDAIHREEGVAVDRIQAQAVRTIPNGDAEGTRRAGCNGVEVADAAGSAQAQIHVCVIIREPVRRAAENKAVVRVPGEEDFRPAFGVDGIDADIAISVGAEIDFEEFACCVHGILIAIGPQVDVQAMVIRYDGTGNGHGTAGCRVFQHRDEKYADCEDEYDAFHGLPPCVLVMRSPVRMGSVQCRRSSPRLRSPLR